MEQEMMILSLVASSLGGLIPKDKSLSDRIQFSMRYVREHEIDLFWMIAKASDDIKFRAAIAAVAIAGSDDDRSVIERSMKPLLIYTAIQQGIPVDIDAMPQDDDLLPLMKLWHESGTLQV